MRPQLSLKKSMKKALSIKRTQTREGKEGVVAEKILSAKLSQIRGSLNPSLDARNVTWQDDATVATSNEGSTRVWVEVRDAEDTEGEHIDEIGSITMNGTLFAAFDDFDGSFLGEQSKTLDPTPLEPLESVERAVVQKTVVVVEEDGTVELMHPASRV